MRQRPMCGAIITPSRLAAAVGTVAAARMNEVLNFEGLYYSEKQQNKRRILLLLLLHSKWYTHYARYLKCYATEFYI
jgi:hypothetical protein